MTMPPRLLSAVTVALLLAATPQVLAQQVDTLTARALHARLLTIDTHDDISSDFATEKDDPGSMQNKRQVTLPKMIDGGLDVAFFIVYVGQGERTEQGYEAAYQQAVRKFDAIHRLTETMYPSSIELATSPGDVVRIHKSGKLVACIGVENGYPIGKDLAKVKEFYDRGGRYITLSHMRHNDICDSANPGDGEPEEEHHGVSDFGRTVIGEMNRLGIMVDVSHISKKSALDAMKFSLAPVIASHSGIRAVNDNPRNLDDETLFALMKNGGVVQCVGLGEFVKTQPVPPERQQAVAALRKEFGLPEAGARVGGGRRAGGSLSGERLANYRERLRQIDSTYPLLPVTVRDFADHIDYAVKLIGINHVGISSDFDGGGGITGWNNAAETPNVTVELVRRGYSEEDIAKLWGGNLLRVWGEVERIAAELQKKK